MTESSTTSTSIDPRLHIKTYWLIRQGQCPKLGAFSSGQISYQLLAGEGRDELFLRISGNEGGGYVSDEAVAFSRIMRCIDDHDPDKPLRSAHFREAFTGRSNNNWGFLSAILLHEGLLERHPAQPHLLIDCGEWGAWRQAQLAETSDDAAEVKVGKLPRSIGSTPPASAPAQVAPALNGTSARDDSSHRAEANPPSSTLTLKAVRSRRK
ncbi:hypothetical protein ACU6VI_07075 [Sphaerotilus natans]|uniref:hypothetical protein n=1 Tax=Sphaerotilus natans TaxID=34103 RepID=UPI00406D4135